jgi:hypothetical protein
MPVAKYLVEYGRVTSLMHIIGNIRLPRRLALCMSSTSSGSSIIFGPSLYHHVTLQPDYKSIYLSTYSAVCLFGPSCRRRSFDPRWPRLLQSKGNVVAGLNDGPASLAQSFAFTMNSHLLRSNIYKTARRTTFTDLVTRRSLLAILSQFSNPSMHITWK